MPIFIMHAFFRAPVLGLLLVLAGSVAAYVLRNSLRYFRENRRYRRERERLRRAYWGYE